MPAHMNRKAAKRDTAEPAIVAALKKAGCSVVKLSDTGVPDLLVAYPLYREHGLQPWQMTDTAHDYATILVEVKTGNARLTEEEEKFAEKWQGRVYTVRTPQYALELIGVSPSDFALYID